MLLICITVLLCSCSANIKNKDKVPIYIQATTNVKTETSILSMNSETNNVITEKQATIQNTEFEKVIECIQTVPIGYGSFYDFDKDGIPEILEQQLGEMNAQVDYTIYKLQNDTYIRLGTIYANEISAGNKFTLYKDNESGELFYIGDHVSEVLGEGESSTYKYVFKDDEIIATLLAYYHFTYTQTDLEAGKVLIDSCYFLKDRPDLNTYHSTNEMNKIMGVEDYLSQFEKIEEPDLYPRWHRFDDNLENEVKMALEEFYKKSSDY